MSTLSVNKGNLMGKIVLFALLVAGLILSMTPSFAFASPGAPVPVITGVPSQPTGLYPTPLYGAVKLTWNAPPESNITKYIVQYREESPGGTNPWTSVTINSATAYLGTTIGGLYIDNTSYEFRVKAVNSNNLQSLPSSSVFAFPKNAP